MRTETFYKQRFQKYWVAALLCAMVWLDTDSTSAQDTNTLEIIKQLQKRIEELEQKVKLLESSKSAEGEVPKRQEKHLADLEQKIKILERNRELEAEAAEAKAKEAPQIKIGGEGFSLASADNDFSIQLNGILQVDSRIFLHDSGIDGNDTLLLRRARPILQGTVYRDFDFLFVPDFGGTGNPQIFDAFLNYRYSPELQLRAGKFKSPIGLEQLVADRDTLFNERAMPTTLIPNRDLGIDLRGDLFKGVMSYDVGIFNGVGDGRNSSNFDFDDNRAFEGRIFFLPFKETTVQPLRGVGLGVSGSYENMRSTNVAGLPATTGGLLPGYSTDGQQQFFAYNPTSNAVVVAAGEHWRLSPQGYYYYGPFGFLAEYVISDQQVRRTVLAPFTSQDLQHTAWQISGSWLITGEDAAYGGPLVPRRSFNPRQGGWGALQLVGRYSEVDIDNAAFPLFSNPSTSATLAQEWSVGLNWYLNRNVLVKASYSHTAFSGGGGSGILAPAAVTRKDENVLFTRIQLSF